MTLEIQTSDGLRATCIRLASDLAAFREQLPWFDDQIALLRRVQSSTVDERATLEFQRALWVEHPIPVSEHAWPVQASALQDERLRRWLAEAVDQQLPKGKAGLAGLEEIQQKFAEQLSPYHKYLPRLQIRRFLATFYPETIGFEVHKHSIRGLAKALGLTPSGRPIRNAIHVMALLEQVLGPADGLDAIAVRAALPVALAKMSAAEAPPAALIDDSEDEGGDEALSPLPAIQRRKGLTALKGGLGFVYPALDFVGGGVSRDQLRDYVRSQMPGARDSTLASVINVITNEFGLLDARSGMYELSERGVALLETKEPSVLAEWLLTRVLGVDHACKWLLDEGPQDRTDFVERLRGLNPGWTTTFAPLSLLSWLRSLEVVRSRAGQFELTPRGRDWAARVIWPLESLRVDDNEEDDEIEVAAHTPATQPGILLPDFGAILDGCRACGHFPESLVAELHAGLWSDARRHFAILAGLSGSGKTLLARAYANALHGVDTTVHRHLCTVPVQPGWHDPSALLGFVNPLNPDAYVRTAFLEFLLRAVVEPTRPFVVVLDEMNLSHPERYLAPLLSAMETGEALHLHAEGDRLDGVPGKLPYPSNLVLIGTVNMDETTHGISDKVLDRAFTLEFWDIDVTQYPGWEACALAANERARLQDLLADLGRALAPARLHFGWRIVRELIGFLERARELGAALSFDLALDAGVYAKVLPKLRGEDRPSVRKAFEAAEKVLADKGLERSRAKVKALREELEVTGSAHFWR